MKVLSPQKPIELKYGNFIMKLSTLLANGARRGKRLAMGFSVAAAAILASAPASADYVPSLYTLSATLTADNHYMLFIGGWAGEDLRLVSSDEGRHWGELGSVVFHAKPNEYLYVLAWNDDGPNGWIGAFTQIREATDYNSYVYSDPDANPPNDLLSVPDSWTAVKLGFVSIADLNTRVNYKGSTDTIVNVMSTIRTQNWHFSDGTQNIDDKPGWKKPNTGTTNGSDVIVAVPNDGQSLWAQAQARGPMSGVTKDSILGKARLDGRANWLWVNSFSENLGYTVPNPNMVLFRSKNPVTPIR